MLPSINPWHCTLLIISCCSENRFSHLFNAWFLLWEIFYMAPLIYLQCFHTVPHSHFWYFANITLLPTSYPITLRKLICLLALLLSDKLRRWDLSALLFSLFIFMVSNMCCLKQTCKNPHLSFLLLLISLWLKYYHHLQAVQEQSQLSSILKLQ